MHQCPLSLCPRKFESKEGAKSHCELVHGVTQDELGWFNETYDEKKGIRVNPSSLGNSVDFEYVNCGLCDETKTVPQKRLSEYDVFFCSIECRSGYFSGPRHPQWKEKTDNGYYGPNWQEKRSKRITIDDGQCVLCGLSRQRHQEIYQRDLSVHHIVPRRKYRRDGQLNWREANRLANLVALCASCHQRHEGESVQFFEEIQNDAKITD